MRTARQPNDTRISLRVTAHDLTNWRTSAELIQKPLSAMIRRAVNEYVDAPPPSSDFDELPFSFLADLLGGTVDARASLRNATRCDKTIVLRVNRAVWRQWQLSARWANRSVSAMIRRAVRRHVYPFGEFIKILQGSGGQIG